MPIADERRRVKFSEYYGTFQVDPKYNFQSFSRLVCESLLTHNILIKRLIYKINAQFNLKVYVCKRVL